MAERVVLAYSGGLDTSVGIGWLQDATGKEVVALAVDVGQGGEDMEDIRQRALDCGAVEAIVVDAKDEFANDFLMPALKANALYQKRYPLVSALSRPVIARHLARVARELGADSVAHGCTGKGNDQVRFEAAVAALAPELTSIAPIRDLALTRDKAIAYAEEHGLPIKQSKKNPYSIDKNVWGRAVETGFLEDPWNAPIEDLYEYTADPTIDGPADEVHDHVHAGHPDGDRRRRGHAAAGRRAAQRARRPARRRPHRHRRGPPGRHQEPRGLRGSGRDRPHRRARGAREPDARARRQPLQARRRGGVGRTWSTTASGTRD